MPKPILTLEKAKQSHHPAWKLQSMYWIPEETESKRQELFFSRQHFEQIHLFWFILDPSV
jgi:hypothetical protein